MDREVLKKNSECAILRNRDTCYGTFNYYLFSTEGDIVLSVTNCNRKEIPPAIEEMFEKFSLEVKHKKEKEEFETWLERAWLKNK